MADLTDAELKYALDGQCHSVEVVVWLAREVKRYRDALSGEVSHEALRGIAICTLDRHLVGTAKLGVVMRNRIAESVAVEVADFLRSGPAPDRILEYHLEEIDEWRSGRRASAGMPAEGWRYSGAMLDAIARHERALIDLGHAPTRAYVQAHGWADGRRGPWIDASSPAVPRLDVATGGVTPDGSLMDRPTPEAGRPTIRALFTISTSPSSGDSPTPSSGDSPTPSSGDSPTPSSGDSQPASSCMPEVFPFVSPLHREVILRPRDGKSQDIEMTPVEADFVAHVLWAAAVFARSSGQGNWYGLVSWFPVFHCIEPSGNMFIELSGNAPIEIFPSVTHKVRLWHRDGESQDLEMTPEEADGIADKLHEAAEAVRTA